MHLRRSGGFIHSKNIGCHIFNVSIMDGNLTLFRVTLQTMAACHCIIRQYLSQSPCIIFIADATTKNFSEQQVNCKMTKDKHHEPPLPP